MWQEYFKIFLAKLALSTPVLIALLVGFGLALVERSRGSASSLWAVMGFGLQFIVEISRAFVSILTMVLNVDFDLPMDRVGVILVVVSIALNLLSAAAWSMVIMALLFRPKAKA